MEQLRGASRTLIELAVLLTVLLFMIVAIQMLTPADPAAQIGAPAETSLPVNMTSTAEAKVAANPGATEDLTGLITKSADTIHYPAPETKIPQPSTPPAKVTPAETVAPIPETPALPAGQAATLHNGDIWLVEPGVQPVQLTDYDDVFLIFDWNRDGTKLLYGRGNTLQAWGYTTELWLLELNAGKSRPLTTTGLVKSASWSPVDDRLAYCENGNVLTIIDLDGLVLNQRDRALCMFTWSPDGQAIAVESYTPDMVDSDGLANTVLGVWWLKDDRLQVFSDAKDEVHASPVWSMDGLRIMFDRLIYDYSDAEQNEQGLYVADVSNGQIRLVRASPSQAIIGLMRSPQADLVSYRIGHEIYVMDFEGNSSLVGQGPPPYYAIWLLDGRTLLHRAEMGDMQIITSDIKVKGEVVGGWLPTMGQFEYFVRP